MRAVSSCPLPTTSRTAALTVEAQLAGPGSTLNLHRRALRLRRELPNCAPTFSPGVIHTRTSRLRARALDALRGQPLRRAHGYRPRTGTCWSRVRLRLAQASSRLTAPARTTREGRPSCRDEHPVFGSPWRPGARRRPRRRRPADTHPGVRRRPRVLDHAPVATGAAGAPTRRRRHAGRGRDAVPPQPQSRPQVLLAAQRPT